MSQHKLQNEGFKSNVILPSRDMRSRDYDVEKINADDFDLISQKIHDFTSVYLT